MHTNIFRSIAIIITCILPAFARAEPIVVTQTQGISRGFLIVRTQDGKAIATGELTQTAHGDHITARLVYRFRDGSIDDETTVYTQARTFQMVSDHHIQKGPFFSKPVDALVEANGQVTIHSWDKDGKETVESQHMDLPPDVYNGLVGTLLINIPRNAPEFKVSYVAPSGKGRLIKLDIAPAGTAQFSVVGVPHTANIFRIKIDLGGVAGVLAPVVGKQPADQMIWVLEGEAPAFIREVGQLSEGGPVVSIELSGTSFRRNVSPAKP